MFWDAAKDLAKQLLSGFVKSKHNNSISSKMKNLQATSKTASQKMSNFIPNQNQTIWTVWDFGAEQECQVLTQCLFCLPTMNNSVYISL